MTHEFKAVVRGDGKYPLFDRQELLINALGKGVGRAVSKFLKKAITRTSLNQREDRPFSPASYYRIGFPVAQTGTLVNNKGSFRDRPPGVPTAAFRIFMDPLAVSVLPPQMHVEIASTLFVPVNVKIDRLVRNRRLSFQLEPLGYLLRTPFPHQQVFHP